MAAGEALVAGVPLAQYAAVTAALAEPFPLDDVLVAESLDPAAWTEADLGWTERLAADASLLARYETDLAAAEDRLARPVSPVDADLGAWVAFLSAFTASPSDLLQQHGLGPNDLSRLRRRWTRRMKDDPALEKRAADLRKKGPSPLPPLRVGKAKLVGSGAQARATPAESASEAPADPSAERDARLLRAHRQTITSISIAAPQAAPVDAPPSSQQRPAHEDSTLVGYEVKGADLPFRATPSRAFLEAMDRPGAAAGEGSDGDTAALRAAQALRALPLGGDIDDEITHALPAALPEEEPPLPTLELHPAADEPVLLSLERHASLCLELMVDPLRADETLARYQVTAGDKDRADQFYKARFTADPALRAAWNQAFETYRLWFVQRPRG